MSNTDHRDFYRLQAQQHARALEQQMQMQMAQMHPFSQGGNKTARQFDVYERTQLALNQLQILFSLGELEKHELRNATKMAMSSDRENLVVVEQIIKSKLG